MEEPGPVAALVRRRGIVEVFLNEFLPTSPYRRGIDRSSPSRVDLKMHARGFAGVWALELGILVGRPLPLVVAKRSWNPNTLII